MIYHTRGEHAEVFYSDNPLPTCSQTFRRSFVLPICILSNFLEVIYRDNPLPTCGQTFQRSSVQKSPPYMYTCNIEVICRHNPFPTCSQTCTENPLLTYIIYCLTSLKSSKETTPSPPVVKPVQKSPYLHTV